MGAVEETALCVELCTELLPAVMQMAQLMQHRPLLGEQQQGQQGQSQRESKPTHAQTIE